MVFVCDHGFFPLLSFYLTEFAPLPRLNYGLSDAQVLGPPEYPLAMRKGEEKRGE